MFVSSIFVLRGAWDVHQKASVANIERGEALRTLNDLEMRTGEFQASLGYLETGHGVERELRKKFSVAKPWEEVVIIVDETDQNGKNSGVLGQSFWSRVKAVWQD